MRRTVYIMRGIPGSGKSTKSRELAGSNGSIHSTDEYFLVDGEYVFDPNKLAEYHARNLEAFTQSLRDSVEIVICDNTNVQIGHMLPYLQAAQIHGYEIWIVEMAHPDPNVAATRNTHGVTVDGIRRMISRWEPWPADAHLDVTLLRIAS